MAPFDPAELGRAVGRVQEKWEGCEWAWDPVMGGEQAKA